MSGELQSVKQQLAYQTGLIDGIRQGGMQANNYFQQGTQYMCGLGNRFMGFCASMNPFGLGRGIGFGPNFGPNFGCGFGFGFGLGRIW